MAHDWIVWHFAVAHCHAKLERQPGVVEMFVIVDDTDRGTPVDLDSLDSLSCRFICILTLHSPALYSGCMLLWLSNAQWEWWERKSRVNAGVVYPRLPSNRLIFDYVKWGWISSTSTHSMYRRIILFYGSVRDLIQRNDNAAGRLIIMRRKNITWKPQSNIEEFYGSFFLLWRSNESWRNLSQSGFGNTHISSFSTFQHFWT